MSKGPLGAWNAFWFRPTSARPLGAFRIAFGLLVLAHLALYAIDFDHWLTDAGLLRGGEARELAGPWRPSPLQWVQDPASVRVAVGGTAVVAALFTLGWRTRVMGVLLYLGLLSIHHRNLASASGADVLMTNLAFLLMLSPCGAACSLDARRARRRRGTPAEALILPWTQRLIQVQVALVYFCAALIKAGGPTWQDGTALHYVLSNAEVRRFTFGLTGYPLAINALTHGAVVLECALAFLLWFRATRPWAILGGLALHLGIGLTVNIPIFGELMVAGYLTFLAPDELDALLRALDPRGWRRPRRASATIPGRVDAPSGGLGPHRAEPSAIARAHPDRSEIEVAALDVLRSENSAI